MATRTGDAPLPPYAAVVSYRVVIEELCQALGGATSAADTRPILEEYLDSEQARGIVIAAAGSPAILVDRAADELESYRPTAAATARTAAEVVKILLLQQIDLAWWADAADFEDQDQLARSAEVVDLRVLKRADRLRFSYSLASDALVYRARNFAIRRWWPDRAPGAPGPSSAFVRPEVVELLNLVADRFAAIAGPTLPALWVNSVTRPLDHQLHLQRLGFTAYTPSAHCRGWAADIETAWYDRFGVRAALESMLQGMVEDGLINGIDEGRIWHVCPNPERLGEFTLPTNKAG